MTGDWEPREHALGSGPATMHNGSELAVRTAPRIMDRHKLVYGCWVTADSTAGRLAHGLTDPEWMTLYEARYFDSGKAPNGHGNQRQGDLRKPRHGPWGRWFQLPDDQQTDEWRALAADKRTRHNTLYRTRPNELSGAPNNITYLTLLALKELREWGLPVTDEHTQWAADQEMNMSNVATDYPARREVDSNGERVWFKPAIRSAGETWGWTADPAQAHPDYQVKLGTDGSLVTWVGNPWGVCTCGPGPVGGPGWKSDCTQHNVGELLKAPADFDPATLPARIADLDDALAEGYVDHDQVAKIADRLISQTTVTLSDPVVTVTTTTTKGTTMTELAVDGTEVEQPRFTEFSRYPLPPAPPRLRVTYDGYGRYKLPSPTTGRPTGFSRATTIAKTLEETYNLSRWSRRQAVKAIVRGFEELASGAQSNADGFDTAGGAPTPASLLSEVRAAISGEDDRALDKAVDMLDNVTGGADARELGEAVHAWLEAIDIGSVLPWQVPEMFAPYVAAARDALRRAGLVACPEYVERIVLNDRGDETVVGTIDRIYRCVTTGELIMGDVKTSKTLEYSWLSYSVQVGGVYGYATLMMNADGDTAVGQHGWLPMPQVNQELAVILHVPSDQPERSAVVTIDMYFGGESMVESLSVRKRRKDAKTAVPKHAVPVPSKAALRYVAARDAMLDARSLADIAGVWDEYKDIWTDDLTSFGEHVADLLDASA